MNETHNSTKNNQGASNMKKTLFVVVVALAVMAIASSAYAYGYENWNAGLQGTALSTPHKDYRLNTVKCAVCHAAHQADPNGELLLRSTIANACTYCHIDSAVGGKRIYNADPDNYTIESNYAHNSTAWGFSCSSCHSVHGASTYNFSNTDGLGTWQASVNSKILRMYPAGDADAAWDGLGDAAAPAGYGRDDAATRDMAVTGFCTQCHSTMFATDSQTAKNFAHAPVPGNGMTHPMVRDDSLTTFSPALQAGSTVAFNGQVAFANSEACRSCHDAGLVDQAAGTIADSFPHYTPGAEFFLMGASNVSGSDKADVADSDLDGVCLKCHRDQAPSGVTRGVGLNY